MSNTSSGVEYVYYLFVADKHTFEVLDDNSKVILQDLSCDGTEGAVVECNHAPLWPKDGCVSAVILKCEGKQFPSL